MAIEVFNRIEKKYLITEDIYAKFYYDILEGMVLDKYCKEGKHYSINNIYFDTDTNELIRNSIEKPVYKEKLRLRSYGVPDMDSKVFLEIKKKYQGIVNKRRIVLKLQQAYDFTLSGIIPHGPKINEQVTRELDYFMRFYKPKPVLFLAYDRVAMFGKEDENLRITFDRNIRTRREDVFLEKGDWGKQLLNPGEVLMEIKVPGSIPLWLTDILTKYDIKSTSYSKYGTEYKNYITDGGFYVKDNT